jgi:hypothetical protein
MAGVVFGQNITDEKIRSYAQELGVPVEELRLLVEKHQKRSASGFTDPRAKDAQVIDIQEANFLAKTKKAKRDILYVINNCRLEKYYGDSISFATASGIYNFITVRTDVLFRIRENTLVDILLEYNSDKVGILDFYIVEIITH